VHDLNARANKREERGEREMGGPCHKCQAWARAHREKRSHKHATCNMETELTETWEYLQCSCGVLCVHSITFLSRLVTGEGRRRPACLSDSADTAPPRLLFTCVSIHGMPTRARTIS
jgi:hypothetical protein